MAQRRMFSKEITNSSIFLKMPISSRLLYYDLGMNADDDGFVEHFMVLRMTGATMQDLGVLELNGLIKIFDENVLWIKDWKINNYIQKDRYQPSKYLQIYNIDSLCIQNVYTGKDSIGKVSIDKDSIGNNIYCRVIDYLNEKTNSNYKHSTQKTQSVINARIKEGFTEEDFKIVIDKKCDEWLNTDMQKFLRPETLFGTKFESYLNQPVKQTRRTLKDIKLSEIEGVINK